MQPRMSAAEITQLELQLAGRDSLLQFGCGNATLVAARQVRKIVAVDGDAAWLGEVGANLARAAIDFTPFHADIGPTREGGYPAGESRVRDRRVLSRGGACGAGGADGVCEMGNDRKGWSTRAHHEDFY